MASGLSVGRLELLIGQAYPLDQRPVPRILPNGIQPRVNTQHDETRRVFLDSNPQQESYVFTTCHRHCLGGPTAPRSMRRMFES